MAAASSAGSEFFLQKPANAEFLKVEHQGLFIIMRQHNHRCFPSALSYFTQRIDTVQFLHLNVRQDKFTRQGVASSKSRAYQLFSACKKFGVGESSELIRCNKTSLFCKKNLRESALSQQTLIEASPKMGDGHWFFKANKYFTK